jgi:hypothetical protein
MTIYYYSLLSDIDAVAFISFWHYEKRRCVLTQQKI